MSTTQSPSVREIATFLTTLYGLNITTKEDDSPFNAYAAAHYVDDSDTLQATIFCDLAGGAKLGAALTQIPVGGVEDAISAGALPDNIRENLSEAFNILVNIFPEHASQRLTLKDVTFADDAATEFAGKTDGNPTAFQLEIQRYGSGLMSVFVGQ